jgi:D-alanyl-D-alanine carboxypeptidase
MGLSENEVLDLDDLLYGLVLHSGNDAAETIADNYKSGRANFIKAMNQKAYSLGLSSTRFSDPSGLAGDGEQYSTAYDLLVMTKYALGFSAFAQVVQTFDYNIPKTSVHSDYELENETNLLTSYPGVKGVKTGYTDEAGLCLVTYLNYDGHKIIGVILNSENRIDDMKRLLDFSLKEQGITPPVHS